MVTTRPPKTIVKPTALGPVANTDTKLLIYGLFQKGRVLVQDGKRRYWPRDGVESTTSGSLTAPWPIGLRRQRPNSPARRHCMLSSGVDFTWSRVE